MSCCLYQVLAIIVVGLNFSVKEASQYQTSFKRENASDCRDYCNKDCFKHFANPRPEYNYCVKANVECKCGVNEGKSQWNGSSQSDCKKHCDKDCMNLPGYDLEEFIACFKTNEDCNCGVKEDSFWPAQSDCTNYCHKDCFKHYGNPGPEYTTCLKANEDCYCGVKEDVFWPSQSDCTKYCHKDCQEFWQGDAQFSHCVKSNEHCKCGFQWLAQTILGAMIFVMILCSAIILRRKYRHNCSPNSRLVDNHGTIQPNAGVEPNLSQPGSTHYPSAPPLASGASVSTQVVYNPGSNNSNFPGRSDGLPSYSEVVLENADTNKEGVPVSTQVLYNSGFTNSTVDSEGLPSYSEVVLEKTDTNKENVF